MAGARGGRHRRQAPGKVTRRELLAGGIGAVAAVAAGAALGSRRGTVEAPHRWSEIARERFLAGPTQDHDLWFRPFQTRQWSYEHDRAVYSIPTVNPAPHEHVPEPIWRLDVDCRDGDINATMQLSDPTMSAGVLFRGDSFARAYAAVVHPDGTMEVSRHEELRREVLGTGSHAIRPGTPFHVRLELTGEVPRVRARAWPSGIDEPPFWHVDVVDESPDALSQPGPMGVVVFPPAPGRSGSLTLWGSIVRSDEVPFPTPAGVVAAFAGPPLGSDNDPGLSRFRVRARSGMPATFRLQVGDSEPQEPDQGTDGADGRSARFTVITYGPVDDITVTATRAEGGFPSEASIAGHRTVGSGQPVSIAFGSCTFPRPVHHAFATIASLEPSLFIHLGDLGYAHSSRWSASTPTPDAYLDRWARLMAEPGFRALQAVSPVVVVQDDHDFGGNNCWVETCEGWAGEAFEELHANPSPRGYFNVELGDVEVFVLNVREFATDPRGPDGPSKSRLGLQQTEWLFHAMEASRARLLVVASPTPLRTRIPADPSWETAYVYERQELLRRWLELESRVVMLSGDAHGTRLMANVDPNGSGRTVFDLLAAGTEQDVDVGELVEIHDPDRVTDPDRSLAHRVDCFGWLDFDPAGSVSLRSRASATGDDLFEPLVIPVEW
jgi:alkaline phosphatase D